MEKNNHGEQNMAIFAHIRQQLDLKVICVRHLTSWFEGLSHGKEVQHQTQTDIGHHAAMGEEHRNMPHRGQAH
jgi:hypothetical protein